MEPRLTELRGVSVYIDWGTITDSEGTKFQVYFASFVPGPMKYHTLAIVTNDVSKDAQHGALMLREVLDPKRDPLQQGQSVLRRFFPAQCTRLYIHGDTGNGYRSYEVQISRILYSVDRVCADVGPPSSVRAGIWCAAFSKKSVPTACGKHFRSSASRCKHVSRVLQGSWTCDRARGNCSSLARRSAQPLSVLFPFHLFRAGMCRCWQGGIWSRVQALDDGAGTGVHTRTSSPCESLNQRAFTV